MKHFLIILLTCSVLVLSGCGNMLATMKVDTIEDDPVERTMAQVIEDDNIETKATVSSRGKVAGIAAAAFTLLRPLLQKWLLQKMRHRL